MTDFGDRVLVLIIIATGLAGLFGWVTGTYLQGEARIEGIERFFIHATLIAIYFLILIQRGNPALPVSGECSDTCRNRGTNRAGRKRVWQGINHTV